MPNYNEFDLLRALLNNTGTSFEDKLKRWAASPSKSEKEKCDRSERMVKAAIAEDPELSRMDISVYAKGSFANRTNIPADSDVDVAVVRNDLFYNEYPDGMTSEQFRYVDHPYTFNQFRNDVSRAVVNYFGKDQVDTSGTKAIKVHSNTARVDADVVPQFVHRRYLADRSYEEGVALREPSGKLIYNWPAQDYSNGVRKNDRTGKRYKALVRILKNLRAEMEEAGEHSVDGIASYLIACLVWNVPDHFFAEETYEMMTMDALAYLIERTSDIQNVFEWGEVNELKYLFRTGQPWNLNQTHMFLFSALKFLKGLKR